MAFTQNKILVKEIHAKIPIRSNKRVPNNFCMYQALSYLLKQSHSWGDVGKESYI